MIVPKNKTPSPNSDSTGANQQASEHFPSSIMFVPFVGHLFTCDHESIKRYCYYNNLEKNRRAKIYKQLIKNKNEKIIKLINQTLYDDEDSDEEEEDEEEEEEGEDEEEEDEEKGARKANKKGGKQMNTTSKSDNDLRAKKSVKFLPHANTTIDIKRNKNSNSVSPSSTITTEASESTAASTPTSLLNPEKSSPFYDHAYVAKQQQQQPSNAPLLQYNALIAMLKSNASVKAQKDHILNLKETVASKAKSENRLG